MQSAISIKMCVFCTLDLASDELSQRALPQLRRVALRQVERRCDHLTGGSVHADEMDEAREILQVSGSNRVKTNRLRTSASCILKDISSHLHVVKNACASTDDIDSHTTSHQRGVASFC